MTTLAVNTNVTFTLSPGDYFTLNSGSSNEGYFKVAPVSGGSVSGTETIVKFGPPALVNKVYGPYGSPVTINLFCTNGTSIDYVLTPYPSAGAVTATSGGVQNLAGADLASIVWTGTTAPSGALVAQYSWQQVGNMVTLLMGLNYATAGAALTAVAINLPAACPVPKAIGVAAGLANNMMFTFAGSFSSNNDSTPKQAILNSLSVNSGNNGYTIASTVASGAIKDWFAAIVYETGI